MKNKLSTIILFGTYAEENCGDDLMLISQILALRKRMPSVRLVVFTGDCAITEGMLKNECVSMDGIELVYTGRKGLREPGRQGFSSFKWIFVNLKEIFHSELLIIGPGNQIQDVTRKFRVVFFLSRGWLAWVFRTPFVFMGVGYYGLVSRISKTLFRLTANLSAFFTTRDEGGAVKSVEAGVRKEKVHSLADVSFTYPWPDYTEKVPVSNPVIGLTSRIFLPNVFDPEIGKNYEKSYSLFLHELHSELDARFVFFPYYKTEPWNDIISLNRLLEMNDNAQIPLEIYNYPSLNDLSDKISQCDAVIGTRYHSVLMSVQRRVPVMGISYAYKTRRFMEENGLSDYVIDTQNVTAEKLIHMFHRLWKNRDVLKKEYLSVIDREKPLAEKHFNLIHSILLK